MSAFPQRVRRAFTVTLLAVATTISLLSGVGTATAAPEKAASSVRFATYNASLNRSAPGQLLTDLQQGTNTQAKAIAEVIQRTAPDVMLINEFDYYSGNRAVDAFRTNYLKVSQNGQRPIDYPYAYTAPVNTGVPSGKDLNSDGNVGGPEDAWGFGQFPGQYGMVVLSKFPIETARVRTFQKFLWKDMPGNMIPRNYYRQNADSLRLSSKSHWDVPIRVRGKTIHFVAAHPTPPSFDGPEDRNGRRNHDEVRMSADLLAGGPRSWYLYDDKGARGGLPPGATFVYAGDQNSDPVKGGSVPGTMQQLFRVPRMQVVTPTSPNGGTDTADFAKPDPGNLRVDYVLPSTGQRVTGKGVYWPAPGTDGAELMPPKVTSDHRLVWVDLR